MISFQISKLKFNSITADTENNKLSCYVWLKHFTVASFLVNLHCTWSQSQFYQFKPFLVHLTIAQVRGSSLVIMASWVEVWWAIHHGNSRVPLISAHQPSFETDHAVRQLCVAPGTTHQKGKLNYNNDNDSSHVVGNWCLNGCWLVLMVVSVTVMFSV